MTAGAPQMAMYGENEPWLRQSLRTGERAALLAVPVVIATAGAISVRLALERLGLPALLVGAATIGVAVGMIAAFDRLGRQLLPLSVLLRLAVVFPDQAPSRVAQSLRSASPRRLRSARASCDRTRATTAAGVHRLVRDLAAHDRLTRGHCERVRAISVVIADEMGITGEERDRLEWAALLHDIGKVDVSPAILNKPGAPDDHEWIELVSHPAKGAALIGELAAWLGDSAHAIDQHHERFDGSGYPLGLRGHEIAKAARIVAVADAFEVMTANRSYKSAMTPSHARQELATCSGTHFDPAVVRAFASLSVIHLHPCLGVVGGVLAMSA